MNQEQSQKFKETGEGIIKEASIRREIARGKIDTLGKAYRLAPATRRFTWSELLEFGEAHESLGNVQGTLSTLNRIAGALKPDAAEITAAS